MTLTVFWPYEEPVQIPADVLGWSYPVICVAAVLPCSKTIAGAQTIHLSGQYTIIFYHRHSPSSLRFYAFSNIAEAHSDTDDAYNGIATLDPTRPVFSSEGAISQASIHQFNAAALLHTSSSIALVPFTANLLFSIGYALYSVGEYIIHIAASFIYLMLLFLSLGIRTAYIAVLHALAPLLYIFRPMSPFLSSALHPIFRFVFAGSPTRSAALSEIMKSTSLFIGSSFTLLKDSSATIQQIDIRLEQARYLLTEAPFLRGGRLLIDIPQGPKPGSSREQTRGPSPAPGAVDNTQPQISVDIAQYATRYTTFFNTIWLLLNDITIGIAVGLFLIENAPLLAKLTERVCENVLLTFPSDSLTWLDAWPAGLKLNTELSAFLARSFGVCVNVWRGILQPLFSQVPINVPSLTLSPLFSFATPSTGLSPLSLLLHTLGVLSALFGLSMLLSLMLDLIALVTLHILFIYTAARALYASMLLLGGGLWRVFRGKRYNALRNRTDTWEYDVDQLLLGTILFTLLAFLFPTVLAYYTLFALLRLATILIHAALETLLAFMNHFPLFALMLRVKDPWRLPGGIYFLRTTKPGLEHPMLTVENQPIPLSSIFFQYVNLSTALAHHYNPLRLAYCMLTGRYLAAIPRQSIRYGYERLQAGP